MPNEEYDAIHLAGLIALVGRFCSKFVLAAAS